VSTSLITLEMAAVAEWRSRFAASPAVAFFCPPLLGALLLASGCAESRPLLDQDQDGYPVWEDCDDRNVELGPRYVDYDGDGHGTGAFDAGCDAPADAPGFVTVPDDCDDRAAQVYPEAPELCDGTDNDCDGRVDEDQVFEAGQAPDEIIGDDVDANCNGFIDAILTQVGNGSCCFAGDGQDASRAVLGAPDALVMDSAGVLYIADPSGNRIRRVATDGIISTVAGTGMPGYDGDGGPAIDAVFNQPSGLTIDEAGNLYIADTGNHRIRRVGIDGVVVTVIGTGEAGYSDNGTPAASALLNAPSGLTARADGSVLISDTGNNRVCKLSGDGTVAAVAGSFSGQSGYSGDGGPGASALLNAPSAVTTDGSFNVFIADTGNHRIRRLDANGIITTVVGTGTRGYAGDGATATTAQLNSPRAVAISAEGDLFIADTGNQRIRQVLGVVRGSGTITTVAGCGDPGYAGDGGPAVEAQLQNPSGLSLDGNGNLWLSDTGNNRVRQILW